MRQNIDYSKEASFYHADNNGITCDLCPHYCHLKDGQYGICKSRVNHNNVLYAESFSKVCALNIDPIEKKPLFHFRPGSKCLSIASAGCNLSCKNCQNSDISQSRPSETNYYRMSPDDVIKTCAKYGCDILAFTYTEPLTYYEFTYETAVLAKENGIKTVLVSAGYINEEPLKKLVPFIDAANIDLKSFDDKLYRRLNGASLLPVLNTLKTLHENGVWLEITNLLIPTLNDSEEMIGELCKWLVENGFERTPLHISRFFPTYKLTELPPTPTVSLLMARERAKEAGMIFVYVGNSPEIDGENTYCPTCKTLLIRRDGFVVKENNMAGNKCRNCGETINGIFQHQHHQ